MDSEPDIDGPTGPRRYIRSLNRRAAAPPRLSNILNWELLGVFFYFFIFFYINSNVLPRCWISVKHCVKSMQSTMFGYIWKTAVYFPKMDGGFAANFGVTFLNQTFMEGKLCLIPQFVVCVA